MATPFTVMLPGGGSVTVNASDEAAARKNAGVSDTAQVYAGGHQTIQSGGSTVRNPSAYSGAGEGGTVGGSGTSMDIPGLGRVSGMSGAAIDAYMQALMTGNKAAADEAIRQFNVGFGLNQAQFNESVRQYNQNYGLAQSAVTGTYQGAPTMAAKTLGLQAIQTAATLQSNPFRQAESLYGMSQNGLSPLMQGASGMAPLPAFRAPSLSAADTRSMGWLAQQGGPGSYTQDQSQQWLNGLPAPHQIDWNALSRATPGAQQLVVQGLSQRWGLPEGDIMAIGKATLPAFTSPTMSGRVG